MPRKRWLVPEAQIDALLNASVLRVEEPVRWTSQGLWRKAELSVLGAPQGMSLILNLSISVRLRGKYSYQLRLDSGQVWRRLDVRGGHRNRMSVCGADEVWSARTHKHRYSDTAADSCAYTPADITAGTVTSPGVIQSTDDAGEYERTFGEFLNECGIAFVGQWRDALEEPSAIPMRLGEVS